MRVMLRFPAYDKIAPDGSVGVLYSTLVTAGSIVACNRPGTIASRLMTQAEFGTFRSALPQPPALLEPGYHYYYPENWHLDESPEYAVCPDFRHWGFDHKQCPWRFDVPEECEDDDYSDQEYWRGTCKITGYRDSVESAQLMPEAEENWVLLPLSIAMCSQLLTGYPVHRKHHVRVFGIAYVAGPKANRRYAQHAHTAQGDPLFVR
jgi:hypothetical protein